MSKQTSEKLRRWADGKLLSDIDLSLCAFELRSVHTASYKKISSTMNIIFHPIPSYTQLQILKLLCTY